MNDEELARLYKDYAWYASQCRGSVLNEIIMMERLMDEYISSYFCPTEEKKNELMATIICTEKLTFDGKRQIFDTVFQRRHKEVYAKSKKTIKLLENIMKERNKLAHYMLFYSQEAANGLENKEFTLIRYKDTVTHEVFGEPRITKLIKDVQEVTALLINLHPIFGDDTKITSPPGSDTPALE